MSVKRTVILPYLLLLIGLPVWIGLLSAISHSGRDGWAIIVWLALTYPLVWETFKDVVQKRSPSLYRIGNSLSEKLNYFWDNVHVLVFERAIDILLTSLTIAFTSVVTIIVVYEIPDPVIRLLAIFSAALCLAQCYYRLFPRAMMQGFAGVIAFMALFSVLLPNCFAEIAQGVYGVPMMEALLNQVLYPVFLIVLGIYVAGTEGVYIFWALVAALSGVPENIDPFAGYKELVYRVRRRERRAFRKHVRDYFTGDERRLQQVGNLMAGILGLCILSFLTVGIFGIVHRNAFLMSLSVALFAGGYIALIPFAIITARWRKKVYRRLEQAGLIEQVSKHDWRFKTQ